MGPKENTVVHAGYHDVLGRMGFHKGGYARRTPPGTRRADGQRATETVTRTLAQHLVDLRGIVRAVQGSELFGADSWCVQTPTGDTD